MVETKTAAQTKYRGPGLHVLASHNDQARARCPLLTAHTHHPHSPPPPPDASAAGAGHRFAHASASHPLCPAYISHSSRLSLRLSRQVTRLPEKADLLAASATSTVEVRAHPAPPPLPPAQAPTAQPFRLPPSPPV